MDTLRFDTIIQHRFVVFYINIFFSKKLKANCLNTFIVQNFSHQKRNNKFLLTCIVDQEINKTVDDWAHKNFVTWKKTWTDLVSYKLISKTKHFTKGSQHYQILNTLEKTIGTIIEHSCVEVNNFIFKFCAQLEILIKF